MEPLRRERGGSGRESGRKRWAGRGGAYRSLEAEELSSHCGRDSLQAAGGGDSEIGRWVWCGLAGAQ